MILSKKQSAFIDHLLLFHHVSTPSDNDIVDYIGNQSCGSEISENNPLLDCQKWKEFTIESIIDECWEFWINNAGWIYPIEHCIETENNKIFKKSLIKIRDKIHEIGMLEFYKSHPICGKNIDKINKGILQKYSK